MTRDEIVQKQGDLLDEQFNLRMRKSLKALDNPLRIRFVRRELARIRTVLAEDEMGIRKLAESATSILTESGANEKKDK
ncbi:MAG: 50S ribosomal protein L29 [candidate division Zixibacteria bacterium]|nr:50S ribosomal protein L29 [candidate division Zixibacteria bacterium]